MGLKFFSALSLEAELVSLSRDTKRFVFGMCILDSEC
jgi:hypothetical protein